MRRFATSVDHEANSFSDSKSYQFAQSQQLNASFKPNFKKIQKKRRIQERQKQMSFRKILSAQSIKIIINDQFSNTNIKCQLCEYQYPKQSIYNLCACHHQYCENCLIQYVNYKVGVMQQIRCPDQFCQQKINKNGQIYLKLPQQLKKKYQKGELWRQTIANPTLKLCPVQQCSGQVDIKLNPPQCNICHRQYCAQCMMQRHQGNCQQCFENNHKQWKRCPNCKMFINKLQGCNHIICRCNHEFCFICLQKWSGSHYNCVQRTQMFYFNMETVKLPFILFVLMIALFPIVTVLGVVILFLSFIFMIPVGCIGGLFYTISHCYKLLCFVVLLLPFGAVIGALVLPFVYSYSVSIPYLIHQIRRYRFTLQGLYERMGNG